MRLIPTHGALSGSAGGFVASSTTTGQRIAARTMPRQPRSLSQTAQRNRIGSMAALWRQQTAAQQTAWGAQAQSTPWRDRLGQPITLSGYALFVSYTTRGLNAFIPIPPARILTILEQEGVPIAQTTGITYTQNGVDIAGG